MNNNVQLDIKINVMQVLNLDMNKNVVQSTEMNVLLLTKQSMTQHTKMNVKLDMNRLVIQFMKTNAILCKYEKTFYHNQHETNFMAGNVVVVNYN